MPGPALNGKVRHSSENRIFSCGFFWCLFAFSPHLRLCPFFWGGGGPLFFAGPRPRKFFLSPRRVFGMAGPVRRRTRCGRNAGYSQNPGDGSCAEPSPGFCVCSHWTGRSRAFRIGTGKASDPGLPGQMCAPFPFRCPARGRPERRNSPAFRPILNGGCV